MRFKSSFAQPFMEQILELSAQAQIERRRVDKSSAAFERLSGAILTYGNVLALLTTFRELEALDALPAHWDIHDYAMAVTH